VKGVENIISALNNLPSSSGVYRMIDEQGKILYIGKAKDIKKRVYSYTLIKKLTNRIRRMVAQVAEVQVITTSSETEALMLEARLIKEDQPPYNILLKDGKSYPYIAIDENSDFPRIYKHRGKKKNNVSYFGPYVSASSVVSAISTLQKVFLLRPCTDGFMKSRNRPCMEYEIKRCSAPCVDKISKQDYNYNVKLSKDFLDGKSDSIRNKMQALMEQASDNMDYELAAKYRDRIVALNSISAKQNIYSKTIKDADIISIYQAGDQFSIQVLFVRGSKMLGSSEFFPKGTEDLSEDEVLQYFIMNFYSYQPVPRTIILNIEPFEFDTVKSAITEMLEMKVEIIIPQKGEKKSLSDMAYNNAKLSLERRLVEDESINNILSRVKEIFEINGDIKRIEVFDNSHISGTNSIGAMIVAGYDEEGKWGLQKKLYRKFNVDAGEKKTGGDDFFMMEQVLRRRYERIKKEQNDGATFPDLILIDGGAGQLSVATKVFKEIGLEKSLNYVAIAKGPDRNAGREDFYLPDQTPFKLEANDPALYFLQNLRDEAHRFAITGHRSKRDKKLISSPLDEIPDVGPARKKALLNYFGSAKAVKESDLKTLEKVDGISKELAKKIYNWLN
jgi:excinuclease ABC subunit C